MFASRFSNPHTMAHIWLQQDSVLAQKTDRLQIRHRNFQLVNCQAKDVSCLPVMAYDERAYVRFPSARQMTGKFLPQLGDLLRQHMKTGKGEIVRYIRNYTAISTEHRVFCGAIKIRRTIQQ